MINVKAGYVQEGQAMFAKGIEKYPAALQNIRWFMTRWAFKDLHLMKSIAEGYSKAGLPGEPNGFFKISSENRLTGEELKKIFLGRKVTGVNLSTQKQWWVERSGDGKATIIDGDKSDTGKSWIEDDMLCNQWDNLYENLKDCWVVYRNPEGSPENDDEYIGAPGYGLLPFSLVE